MRKQTARQRADAFCAAVLKRLEEKGITDLTPLSDPDAQYAVYHAERDFARFGTETLLQTLSELVARRMACGRDFLLIPEQIMRLNGDYGVGYTGIMLAIANAEQKCRYRFDPKIWITG